MAKLYIALKIWLAFEHGANDLFLLKHCAKNYMIIDDQLYAQSIFVA